MIITTANQLAEFLKTFDYRCFSWDTETTGLDWFTQKLEGMSLYDGKHACYIYFNSDNWFNIWKQLREVFYKAEVIIGHNLVFDFKTLKKVSSIDLDRILLHAKLIDTQIAQYVINPEEPKGLKALIFKHFRQGRKAWEEMQCFRFDSKEMAEYCMQDSIDAWNLWHLLRAVLESTQQLQVFKIECDFIPVQIEMETSGVLLDQELLKRQEARLDLMKCDLEQKMCESLGLDIFYQGELFGSGTMLMPLNFGSPKKVANYVQERMNIQLRLKTDSKGAYSVGKKAIEDLLDIHPFFPLYQKYQAVRKLLTTYIRPYWGLIKPDGRIYPSFRHARSGRCVAHNPNLQQLAKVNKLVPEVNIRKLFIASLNQKFLKADYAGQELRILAHITGDRALVEAFQAGKDVHLDTANKIFNLGIAAAALYETSSDYKTIKEKHEKQRFNAKAVNFGIAYGQRNKYTQTWFQFYPGVYKAIQRCKAFQKLNGYTVTWAGRRRYYAAFTPADFRSGFNMLIQGTAADMMKKAAGELWRYLRTYWKSVRIILIVHDEIVLEGPKEQIPELVMPVKAYLEGTMKLAVPLVADLKIVDTYGD